MPEKREGYLGPESEVPYSYEIETSSTTKRKFCLEKEIGFEKEDIERRFSGTYFSKLLFLYLHKNEVWLIFGV